MCGIVGLFLKDRSLEPELGALWTNTNEVEVWHLVTGKNYLLRTAGALWNLNSVDQHPVAPGNRQGLNITPNPAARA